VLGAVAIIISLIALTVAVGPFHTGPAGAAGTPAPPTGGALWAVVNETGTLSRASGATSSVLASTGVYHVVFDQSVTSCGAIASLGLNGSYATQAAGTASVTGLSGNSAGLVVSTYNATGVAFDASFHVAVTCDWGFWATVSASGSLVRGHGDLSSREGLTGVYVVNFTQNVNNCSFFATPAGVGGAAPGVGEITVAGLNGVPAGVFLVAHSPTGPAISTGFTVLAVCTSSTWAVVSSTGALVRGSSNGSASLGPGEFQVSFTVDVSQCAWVTSLAEPGSSGSPPPGFITSAGRLNDPWGIWVNTFNDTANLTSASFHIAAFC
jgi:hypothetical protein